MAFILSVIAKSEVLTLGSGTLAESNRIIGAFFRRPYVHIYGVSERTADITADVRRRISLDTPDAIHLATAIERGVPILLTRDGKLLEANGIMNVEIITPKEYFDRLGDSSKQTELPVDGETVATDGEDSK